MISNLYGHHTESFFLWSFYATQSFCQRDSSSQWFHFICLSALFLKLYFLHNDVFVFLMCCLYSAWLWVCWFVLKVSELHSYKVVLWTYCCQRETNLTLHQNHLFAKDSELIAKLHWTKDLVFCWRACWW